MVFPCFHAVFTRTRMQRDRSHNGSFRCRPRERERKREMVVLIEYKVEEAACFIGVFYRERGGNTISFRRGFWPLCKCPWLRARTLSSAEGTNDLSRLRHRVTHRRFPSFASVTSDESFFHVTAAVSAFLSLSLGDGFIFTPWFRCRCRRRLPSMNATLLQNASMKRRWHWT